MISNDHNVYILGAGFSFDAGIPLVPSFMNCMRDAHPWLVERNRDAEAKAVEHVLEFRLGSAGAAHRVRIDVENIEELFSLASSLAGHKGELNESDVRLAIAATIDFSCERARVPNCVLAVEPGTTPVRDWPIDANRKPTKPGERSYRMLPFYDFVVGVMAGAFSAASAPRKNTFISFNYDLVVEQALGNLKVPFSYGFEPKTVNYDGCRSSHVGRWVHVTRPPAERVGLEEHAVAA